MDSLTLKLGRETCDEELASVFCVVPGWGWVGAPNEILLIFLKFNYFLQNSSVKFSEQKPLNYSAQNLNCSALLFQCNIILGLSCPCHKPKIFIINHYYVLGWMQRYSSTYGRCLLLIKLFYLCTRELHKERENKSSYVLQRVRYCTISFTINEER